MNKNLRDLFHNSWIEIALRWILGITFIYASYYKIMSPTDFAKIVYGYNLFPGVLINLIAIILPYVELISGLALLLGIYPRSAALIINGLLLAFIFILTINILRGYEFDCGCFSTKKAGSPKLMVARDIIYLIMGLQVFLFNGARKGCLIRLDRTI
ncbi:MAG: DoxX family membrane protein [Desulfobacterales bacterium]|nr:MAG: DoxX family membrane protein [Desulfobacterales bacterium]